MESIFASGFFSSVQSDHLNCSIVNPLRLKRAWKESCEGIDVELDLQVKKFSYPCISRI